MKMRKKCFLKFFILAAILSLTPLGGLHANTLSSMKGDANGDGSVTVNDVMMIVNHILGTTDNGFILTNADINVDGEIDIKDVMAAVNIILSGEDGSSSYLVVWHKDGSQVRFNLSDEPKITYEGENVVVKGSSIIEYEFQAIKKMTYKLTGYYSSMAPKPFINDGETVTFLPKDKDMKVVVSLITGMEVQEFVVRKSEISSFSLNSYPASMYQINVNGVTYKINR